MGSPTTWSSCRAATTTFRVFAARPAGTSRRTSSEPFRRCPNYVAFQPQGVVPQPAAGGGPVCRLCNGSRCGERTNGSRRVGPRAISPPAREPARRSGQPRPLAVHVVGCLAFMHGGVCHPSRWSCFLGRRERSSDHGPDPATHFPAVGTAEARRTRRTKSGTETGAAARTSGDRSHGSACSAAKSRAG